MSISGKSEVHQFGNVKDYHRLPKVVLSESCGTSARFDVIKSLMLSMLSIYIYIYIYYECPIKYYQCPIISVQLIYYYINILNIISVQ
jgi:hypothetical protein